MKTLVAPGTKLTLYASASPMPMSLTSKSTVTFPTCALMELGSEKLMLAWTFLLSTGGRRSLSSFTVISAIPRRPLMLMGLATFETVAKLAEEDFEALDAHVKRNRFAVDEPVRPAHKRVRVVDVQRPLPNVNLGRLFDWESLNIRAEHGWWLVLGGVVEGEPEVADPGAQRRQDGGIGGKVNLPRVPDEDGSVLDLDVARVDEAGDDEGYKDFEAASRIPSVAWLLSLGEFDQQ